MLRAALALGLTAALATGAAANGRAPATSTIHFRQGHDDQILAGLTFGLIVSSDGGATWRWMCEDAIGYGGLYDPIYGYAASGTVFATTFKGLKTSHDLCTFDPLTAAGTVFASTDALGPDGAYYYGASDPTDAKIYKSTDDGVTFGSGVTPPNGMPNDWWQSITVAPSNAQRVYVMGYRFDADNAKVFLLSKSNDGGATYAPLSTTGFKTSKNSAIEVAGIDATNPDLVYAHVTQQDGGTESGVYRSRDAGATWTNVYTVSDRAFAFLARKNGDLVVGTQLSGSFVSHDQGDHWTALATAPHINCLAENAAGEVWACTANYGVMGGPPSDHAGIMKSTDLATWTPVLKFEDIQAPISCAAGTAQHDTCEAQTWCGLKLQLGITSTAVACALAEGPPALDVPMMHASPGGCCDAGGGGAPGPVLLGLGLALWMRRPARRAHRKPAC